MSPILTSRNENQFFLGEDKNLSSLYLLIQSFVFSNSAPFRVHVFLTLHWEKDFLFFLSFCYRNRRKAIVNNVAMNKGV